jgi:alpha-galactosidase
MIWALSVTDAELFDRDQWIAAKLLGTPSESPFSFIYKGNSSRQFLSNWKLTSDSKKLDELRTGYTLTYTDPDTGLQVRCEAVEYQDYPTVEWTLYFKNTSDVDTPIIENIQAMDSDFSRGSQGEYILHSIKGDMCTPDSYQPLTETLAANSTKKIANTGGRPTQVSFPYYNIEFGGEGLIYVLSWAGQWNAGFARDEGLGLTITGGQELTHFKLLPGEEVRSPLVVLQFYKGDWLRGQNIWRRWMYHHSLPKPDGQLLQPQMSLCCGNYFPALMTVASKEMEFIKRHAEEKIDIDVWWQDAGWYPCDGPGWPKTGTWEPDPVRFPKGIKEVSDLARSVGMKTMVWFEPERVAGGTWITENHPEWVHGGANGGLLKLSDPECLKWLTNHINKLLTDEGIDLYRQDFNIDPLGYWRGADSEDRQGITEIKHVENYFAYWDGLIKEHPGMLIDSCASGGRRNDLETLRRAVPMLRSDYYHAPYGQQCLTYGLSYWFPYQGTGLVYIKGWMNDYWVRSSWATEFSFGPGGDGLDIVDFKHWKKLTDEWRTIAHYFFGDYYPLTPYSLERDVWMAWQFNRQDLDEGCLQVYRRPECFYESARLTLHDLEPDTRYIIRQSDEKGSLRMTGRELMEKGLKVTLENKPEAVTIIYKKLK